MYSKVYKNDSRADDTSVYGKKTTSSSRPPGIITKQVSKIVPKRHTQLPELYLMLSESDKFEKLFRSICIGDGPEISNLKLCSINKNNLKLFLNKRYPNKITERIVSFICMLIWIDPTFLFPSPTTPANGFSKVCWVLLRFCQIRQRESTKLLFSSLWY